MADHDQRFKLLLKEFFAEFLQLFYPAWAERFDFASLEWLEKEVFLDPPQGEKRDLDLLAKVPTRKAATAQQAAREGPWLALVHIEIESPDRVAGLPARMFEYYWHLRLRHRLPVLPIGLYLRVGFDGVGWDEYEESFWDHRLVQFRYAYVGLPALDAFEYVQSPNVLGSALSVLIRVPAGRRAELKAMAMERAATGAGNTYRKHLLGECIHAYLPLEEPSLQEYQRYLSTEPYKEAREMVKSLVEEGIEKGQRALLERQLARRFGPLSANVQQRLAVWPPDRLADLGEAILTAASLRELGLEQDAPPA